MTALRRAASPTRDPDARPRVVAVGGGHGLAQALAAITRYAGSVTAVVTVADDGGSSGRLAPALDIPPPGDIRRCLLALTPGDSVWRRLFDHRFAGGDVSGHSLGNLIIAALSEIEGSFEAALRRAEQLLGAVGSVVPASPLHLRLQADYGGVVITGQVAIARARGRIRSLRVLPEDAEASASAVAAIEAADQIVLGPGSLYTSVIAAMVVPGIAEAIDRSPARLVYVANLVTQDGETLGMDAVDHLEALLDLTGVRSPEVMVANDAPLDVPPPVEPVVADSDTVGRLGVDLVLGDLVDRDAAWPRHDPDGLGKVLGRLVPGSEKGTT